MIDKDDFSIRGIETGEGPFRLCELGGKLYVLNHLAGNIQELGGGTYEMPGDGRPDNIFAWRDRLIIISHGAEALHIHELHPGRREFRLVHEERYPYADTGMDTGNVSFYVRGQFGDALFDLTRALVDKEGRLWISDFLSGRIVILDEE